MKSVYLNRNYDFPLHPRVTVRFHAGTTYSRVLELAAREIERKGAGYIVDPDKPDGVAGNTIDTRHIFTSKRKP